jgi:integrase
MLRKGTKDLKRTNLRMRLIVLIALSTDIRSTEIHRLNWTDVLFGEGLIAVRARLKKGKLRYIPMPSELACEMKQHPVIIGEDRTLPPTRGANKSGRQRLEGSFDDLLERARITESRFHDLRHTFASWYMMIGGDLYELAKILGNANIKMTERCAKLGSA